MSEKPSDISTPPQLETPTLLLDENLSSHDIAMFLRRLPHDWKIELHTDHLPRGLEDVEVIKACAKHGWTLISCDDRIRFVPQNKKAVLDAGIRAFMFHDGNHQGVEYAAALIVGLKHIIQTIRKNAGPVLARIQMHGDVTMFHPPQPKTAGELSSREKTARKYGKKVHE